MATRRSHSSTSGLGLELKSPSKHRAHSIAGRALVRSSTGVLLPVLKVTVSATFDARLDVSVEGARPEGRGLPSVCRAGQNAAATYVAVAPAMTRLGSAARGAIEVDGFDRPVTFSVAQSGQGATFVGEKGRCKHIALQAPSWDWRGGGDRPTEGKAAEVEINGSDLRIQLRAQSAMELKRCLQLQALREAAEGNDYDTLRAQVTKARMASVEMEHIAVGEARLKELREMGLHVNEGCDRASVRELMSWDKVTMHHGEEGVEMPCTICDDCPCNVRENPGEVLEFRESAVQNCLAEFGPDTDRYLFTELVDAALVVEEGCIWRAGGKFIFSEFSRNQSVTALTRMLLKHNKKQCADMVQTLLKHSEQRYQGFVTAIQINFHPHRGTYHDQHRDIYSVKQSAGPNCTCQFQDCVGTVCYSLGSSRLVRLDTMTDNLSAIRPCSEQCQGRRELCWLHSGCSMYFNGDWNNNHTHGIPPSEEECGPRISLAFLLASKPSVF